MAQPAPSIVVLGGGVVGLSIAWEALLRGFRVVVADRPELAGQSSWAGAGILAPAHAQVSQHPLDRFAGTGGDLHRQWSAELLAETGIDNGLIKSGGLYLARSPGEAAALAAQAADWNDEQIECVPVEGDRLTDLAGNAFQPDPAICAAWWVPSEAQVRPPRHLAALRTAVAKRGGRLADLRGTDDIPVSFTLSGGVVRSVQVGATRCECDWLCLAAGAWTGELTKCLGVDLPVMPVRGQMALFQLPEAPFQPIVSLGSRYLVPRRDGLVLAGSTMEEAGFDASTTSAAVDELIQFAGSLFPVLNRDAVVRTWAGLRPATFDGLPAIGRLPGFANAFIATGHLRSGLQLSPATAVMILDQIEHRPVNEEWERLFSPARRPAPQHLA